MTTDPTQPGTWRSWLYDRSSAIFRGYFGRRYMGTIGTFWDTLSQSGIDAFQAPLVELENGPAYDALGLAGREVSMPQYPVEDWLTYRNRIRDPWSTWERAGTEDIIEEQLAAAGLPGAQVLRWGLSEFIVFYGAGTHPVTGYREYGAGDNYGDPGLFYGPEGITGETARALIGLIRHWKPAQWVCPYVIFEISGHTYGTGHTYGEAGLFYGGGDQARLDVG